MMTTLGGLQAQDRSQVRGRGFGWFAGLTLALAALKSSLRTSSGID